MEQLFLQLRCIFLLDYSFFPHQPHRLHKYPCGGLIAFFEFIYRVTNAQYLAMYSKLSQTPRHAASNNRSWSSDYGKITEKGGWRRLGALVLANVSLYSSGGDAVSGIPMSAHLLGGGGLWR